MAGKLQFGIEMVGGDAIEAQLTRIVALQSQISTGFTAPTAQLSQTAASIENIGSSVERTGQKIAKMKGYGLADLPKLFGKSGFAVPDISAEIKQVFKNTTSKSKFEAMENLSKAGGSQDLINQMAEMAKQDVAINKRMEQEAKNQPKVDPILAAWREQMAKIQPNITVAGGGKAPSQDVLDKQQQMWDEAGIRMGKRLQSMVSGDAVGEKSAEDRERAIKKEAMEARRKDQIQSDIRKKEHDHAKFMKDMTFAMMPLMNPGSVWGTLFGARQLFSAFMTDTGQEKIGKFGFSGVGGAASAMGLMMIGLTAAGLALKALGAIAHEAGQAIATGMRLYSKSLMSGLGLGFTTQRSVAAGLLGVPENQLLRFGAALAWLQPRIADITKTMAENARPLATISVEWNILKLRLENVAGTLVVKLKPILDALIDSLSVLTSGMADFIKSLDFKPVLDLLIGALKIVTEQFKQLIDITIIFARVINVLIAFQQVIDGFIIHIGMAIFEGVKDFFIMFGKEIKFELASINNLIIDMFPKIASALGLKGMDTSTIGQEMMAVMKDFEAAFANIIDKDAINNLLEKIAELFGKKPTTDTDKNLLPPPLTMMKQLPVSNWERMGLVIASGNMALDYARRTATAVEVIAHHVMNGSTGSTIPRAHQFNLDPRVTNP